MRAGGVLRKGNDMFEGWAFLLAEIWVLLVLAALLGVLAGWIIWGQREEYPVADMGLPDRLRRTLEQCRAENAAKDARLAELEAAVSAAPTEQTPVTLGVSPSGAGASDVQDLGRKETSAEKPQTFDAPMDGMADDLKQIKGIGVKLERLCNALGFWHYSQIADWTEAEIRWVDSNLEGFKGRVSRDDWVAQAKVLAAGGDAGFSGRSDEG